MSLAAVEGEPKGPGTSVWESTAEAKARNA